MSSEICLICATDEGIFLDIFTNDKALRNNIETCLSLKIYKSKVSSQKICHKCAFELDKCSSFVEHCKSTKRQSQASRQRVRYCSLCFEPGKPGYIHNLHVETSTNALNKIQDIFHKQITLTDNSTSICLECRYNLDVLTDLKKIYRATSSSNFQSVFNGDVDITKLPKIETEVVKRKTTYVPLSKLEVVMSEIDLDSSPPSTKNKNKSIDVDVKSPALRSTKSQKGKQLNSSNDTKKCSVFLKDISSTLTVKKSKDSLNLKSINDEDVDAYISLVSDDSDGDESPSKSIPTINLRKNSKRSFSDPENKISNKKIKKENDDLLLTKRRTRADQILPVSNKTKRRVSETATSEVKIESKSRSKKYIKLESPNRDVKKQTKSKGRFVSATKKLSTDDSAESEEETIKTTRTKRQLRNKSNSSQSSRSKNLSQKLSTKAESADERNQPYTCTVCSTNFDNRVDGMTHELTHSKMLGVILEKVPVPKPAENKEKQQKVSFDVPQSDEENVEKLDETVDEASSSLQDDSSTEKVDENTDNIPENLDNSEEPVDENVPGVDGKNEEVDSHEPEVSLDEENIPPVNQETLDQPELNSVDQYSINNSENSQEEAEKSNDENETVEVTESSENKETIEAGEKEKLKQPEENEETDSIDTRNVEELMKKIHEGQSPDRRTTEPETVKSNNLADDLASSASEMETSELSQMSVEKAGENPPSYESITPPVTCLDENKEKSVENDQSCEIPTITQSPDNDESRVVDATTDLEKINESNEDRDPLNDVDKQTEDSSKNVGEEIETEAQINNDNDKNEKTSETPLDISQKKNSDHKIHQNDNATDEIEKTNTDIPLTQPSIDELEDKLSGC